MYAHIWQWMYVCTRFDAHENDLLKVFENANVTKLKEFCLRAKKNAKQMSFSS